MADLITGCVSQGLKGLILESHGAGNFPSGNPDAPEEGAIYHALKNASKNGVVIVNNTRVISGTVNPFTYASGVWLNDVGALNPADMTSVSTLAKTMILLSSMSHTGWSLETVKALRYNVTSVVK